MAGRNVRRDLAQEARRVGATIRAQQAAILTGRQFQDYVAVTDFLLVLIENIAARDREALLVDAPADVPARDTLRRIVQRLWPAVLLAITAFLLPLLPGFPTHNGLGATIRWGLLVPAALSLVTRQPDVIGRVEATIDKALPGA